MTDPLARVAEFEIPRRILVERADQIDGRDAQRVGRRSDLPVSLECTIGVVVYVEVAGAGAPVVLLHSGACDSSMWNPQWEELCARYRTVRCDLRGFGHSPMTAEWYRDADDVRDILDVAGIDQAFVVGSSRGARVALEVASLYPERVAKLALVCPAFRFGAPSPRMRAFIESEAALLALGDLDAAAELNARTWLGPDAGPAARQLVTQMQKRIYELRADEPRCAPHVPVVELATIKAPTTIISGGRDLDHFRWVATHLASQIQRSELRHLSWAGHLPTLERPSESGVLLQELLAQ